MAKIRHVDDEKFDERYAELEWVALHGIAVLLQLDKFDRREREKNEAGYSATYPHAFNLDPTIAQSILAFGARES